MKLFRWGFVLSLSFHNMAFGLNAIQGFYGGIFGEISAGPSSFSVILPDGIVTAPFAVTPVLGRVNNNRVGGGGGADLGFRLCNFRVEAEVLFNYIGTNNLVFPDCTLISPVVPPTVVCPEFSPLIPGAFTVNGPGFNGNTTGLYGFINGFYDFFSSSECENNWVPYIGIGIGEARIQNQINVVNVPNPPVPPGTSLPSFGSRVSFTSTAAQGILGISLFLDDFTWIGMDYRYVTTNKLTSSRFVVQNNARYAINTLNFFVNFSFDNCDT